MKLITLFLLIIYESFLLTTIKAATCNNAVVFDNPDIPTIINFTAWGFGKGFAPPKRIYFVGIPTARTRFGINLVEDGVPMRPANVMLHFNPRFDENKVVLDTWLRDGGWIKQERAKSFPFSVGKPFELKFRAAPKDTINIFVNYKLFVNFARFDLSEVSQLEITKGVKISTVILCK